MLVFNTKFGAFTNKKVKEAQDILKRQKEEKRPNKADIEKLLSYLVQERQEACSALKKEFPVVQWTRLCEVTVLYLLVFSSSQSGEMQRLLREDFECTKKISKSDDTYEGKELTESEKAAVNKYLRVKIWGEKGRR